ncbi:hypothetical protein CMEL01_08055 [Colletotrichum melonis]|uniref:Heterokaryon incompatibility domain-containing protein n=1 Tax=Colletotrichum melonis TaxID=1209925 RepID=A0AAI9XH27_9PEZI|nr:hypothetical protein CMEL01_08055 [Colletotrichum melonis]
MSTSKPHFVCDACLSLDLDQAMKLSSSKALPAEGLVLDEDATRFLAVSQSDCALCNLLFSLWSRNIESSAQVFEPVVMNTGFVLRAFSYLRYARGVFCNTPGAQNSLMLGITPRNQLVFDEDFFDNHANQYHEYVVCVPSIARGGVLRPQVIPKSFDCERGRLWIDNCREDHGLDCDGSEHREGLVVPGMKLIDCETLHIKPGLETMPWVALSYVWGQSTTFSHQRDGKLLWEDMSASVKDAITVTRGLGYRYLWIDKYCIDQEDEREVEDQIRRMDLIYSKAELTIVAAAGQDETYGLPGVSLTERLEQNILHLDGITIMNTGPHPACYVEFKSKWFTRGWTFQEGLLSRRRIIFTEHQTFFECQRASWMEGLGGIEHVDDRHKVQWSQWKNGIFLLSHFMGQPEHKYSNGEPWEVDGKQTTDQAIARRMHDFFRPLQQFTTRTLTFDTDSLKAAIGLLKILAQRSPPILNFVGLPYSPVKENKELIGPYCFAALSWCHEHKVNPRRREFFPSWTWAGWAGAIHWICYPYLDSSESLSPFMRGLQFESENGMLSTACNYLQLGQESELCPDTRSAVAIHFETPLLSASLFCVNSNESKSSGWAELTIGGHKLSMTDRKTPTASPFDFLERLKNGQWGCLMLGIYESRRNAIREMYLLIIEWQGGHTATRVGALVINVIDLDISMDVNLTAYTWASPWHQVRLI